ncbi:hypothetical protein [Aliiruegeria lutimaris]|uniref:Uncharacterized protein n=1 Tax=Aliiruegeria lutimaris TaxID=571298 RepID=A0A1G9KFU7_9RHOB|nr:hypothetical protein [Aliiruegeria lutimaris]SDL48384.1 hypothetical protein SAMN04488026_10889 [Aliiruegeria lutimaris]
MNETVLERDGNALDGRPLHHFRVTDSEYDLLQLQLISLFQRGQQKTASAPFVLWAAERYRRDFDGGVFSWSFLVDPLGHKPDQAELREMTEIGLRYFNRPPPRRSAAGIQYLRTLAAEGGLPIRLLSQESGYRQALLSLISDLERFGLACPNEQALTFAEVRARRLPLGYRTEEFHQIFVDFARELAALRAEASNRMRSEDVLEDVGGLSCLPPAGSLRRAGSVRKAGSSAFFSWLRG